MKVSHTFICFFLLTLRDGNAEVRRATEGGNITVSCPFNFSGKKRIWCKDECEGKNILIETDQDRAQRGRYSIEYKEGTFPLSYTLLYVSITELTMSDSGRYRCGLVGWLSTSYEDFEIRVDASSASTPTTSQSLSSRSGSSTASSASSETTKQPQQPQRTPAAVSGTLQYMALTLCAMLITLSVAVLIFCRKRARKPKKPPVQTEYANVTEPSQLYEEIREEDRWSRSPPVEISTVYTCTKYTKPNRDETTDKVSFATEDSSQKKTEDDSSKHTYSEVDFSNGAAASVNSAPCGDADNVVYPAPRVVASPPLYSAVTFHQQ